MKYLSTILAATLVAGSCTLALAQAGGSSGAGGADQTQQGNMKDADKNPTGPAANPSAGNTAGGSAGGSTGGMTAAPRGEMTTAPASNTRSDDPARPANTKDNTGAATGSGGSK